MAPTEPLHLSCPRGDDTGWGWAELQVDSRLFGHSCRSLLDREHWSRIQATKPLTLQDTPSHFPGTTLITPPRIVDLVWELVESYSHGSPSVQGQLAPLGEQGRGLGIRKPRLTLGSGRPRILPDPLIPGELVPHTPCAPRAPADPPHPPTLKQLQQLQPVSQPAPTPSPPQPWSS